MLSKNQLKNITALHNKKFREEQALFIVEGEKMVDELLHSAFNVKAVYALPEWLEERAVELERRGVEHVETDNAGLRKISLLSTPNQVLAIAEQKTFIPDLTLFNQELSLYLDGIRDPGNLGTIIRLAHWFGIKQVICSPDCVEIFNPKAVQSTMGSIFHVRIGTAELNDILQKKNDFPVYGAFLDGENLYEKKQFSSGILVIGNESNGISKLVEKSVTDRMFIPPASENHAESLNAAMATSVFLSEYLRRKKYS